MKQILFIIILAIIYSSAQENSKNVNERTKDVNLLPEIVIIGSRSGVRTKNLISTEVYNLEKELSKYGQINLNELLNQIEPSFSSSRKSIRDGTDHVTPASLKGLSVDHVLVLINGKRRHNSSLINVNQSIGVGSSGTDLSAIPAISIKRIEILKGSASAQYGSDAIAGVINIVLKDKVDSAEFQLTTGIHKKGDGKNVQATVNYGLSLGKGGFLNLSGEVEHRSPTNRAGNYQGIIFVQPSGLTAEQKQSYDDSVLNTRGLQRSDFNLTSGNAKLQNTLVFFNTQIPLMKKNSFFYAFGGLGFRFGSASGFYRLPRQSERIVESFYPNGFLPVINSDIQDRSLSAGIKSNLSNWKIDLSHTYGFNSFSFFLTNSNNSSFGDLSKISFNAGGFELSQHTTNFDFSRYFSFSNYGLSFAFGFEHRLDRYIILAGEEQSYLDGGTIDTIITGIDTVISSNSSGSQVFPGFRPENEVNSTRTSSSVYGDFEFDILSILTIASALRYENFSDFGENFNGKIAYYLKLNDFFSLRSSLGTSFKAPSLQQQFFNTVTTQTSNGELVDVGIFRNDSRISQILQLPKLKEETAQQFTSGLIFNLHNVWSFSLDGFFIKINDRIALTSSFTDTANDPTIQTKLIESFSQSNIGNARFFVNAYNTSTFGLDFKTSFDYTFTNKSNLYSLLSLHLIKTEVTKTLNPSNFLSAQTDAFLSPLQRNLIENGTPKIKATLSLNYDYSDFNFLVCNTYFGAIKTSTNNLNDLAKKTYDPKLVTDISITYKLFKNIDLTIGSNNLFDVYPEEVTQLQNTASGRFRYSLQTTQFGFNGAYYYTRLYSHF